MEAPQPFWSASTNPFRTSNSPLRSNASPTPFLAPSGKLTYCSVLQLVVAFPSVALSTAPGFSVPSPNGSTGLARSVAPVAGGAADPPLPVPEPEPPPSLTRREASTPPATARISTRRIQSQVPPRRRGRGVPRGTGAG